MATPDFSTLSDAEALKIANDQSASTSNIKDFSSLSDAEALAIANGEAYEPPTILGEVAKGAKAGWLGANKAVGSIIEYTGKLTGAKSVEDIGKTSSEYWGDAMKGTEAAVQNMTDIGKTGDFWGDLGKWAVWNTAQMGSQMVVTAPFMAAGRARDVKTGVEAIKGLITRAPNAGKDFARFAGEWARLKPMDVPVGILEAGEIAGGQLDELKSGKTKELSPVRGLAAAFVATKLEELGAEEALNKLMHGMGVSKGKIFARIGKSALNTGIGEGTEEFFQAYAEQVGIDPTDITSKENFIKAVNGLGAGFVGGLFMGGGSGVFPSKETTQTETTPAPTSAETVDTATVPSTNQYKTEATPGETVTTPGATMQQKLSALPPEFFAEVEGAVKNGQDSQGNQFTIDDAQAMLDSYMKNPDANLDSAKQFINLISQLKGGAKIQTTPEATEEAIVPQAETVADPVESFRDTLSSGGYATDLDMIIAKGEIATQFPDLIDDLNQVIIDHKASQLGKEAVAEPVNVEEIIKEAEAIVQPDTTEAGLDNEQAQTEPLVEEETAQTATTVVPDVDGTEQISPIEQTNQQEEERKARLFSLSLDQVQESYRQGYISMPEVEEYLANWNGGNKHFTEAYWSDGAIRQREKKTEEPTDIKADGTGGKRGAAEEETAADLERADIKAEIEAISLDDFDKILEETNSVTAEENGGKEQKHRTKKTIEEDTNQENNIYSLAEIIVPFDKSLPKKPTPTQLGVQKTSPMMMRVELFGKQGWTNSYFMENAEEYLYPNMEEKYDKNKVPKGDTIWNNAKDNTESLPDPIALFYSQDKNTINPEQYIFDAGNDVSIHIAKPLYDHFYMRYPDISLKWAGHSNKNGRMKPISVYSGADMVGIIMPINDKLSTAKNFNDALAMKGLPKIPVTAPIRSLDDMVAGMAKEGVAATAETMKGLYELFGGGSLKSFPGGFDSDTYEKARPHFEAALEHAIASGNTLKELVTALVKQFGDVIKPYLKQFVIDKKVEYNQKKRDAGTEVINLDDNTGKGEGGQRKTNKKLTEQEKAERDQKKATAEEEKNRKDALGKFKNIGYVYDPEKLNAKTKDKTPKSAAKIILDEMLPSKVWRVEFAPDASPGIKRLLSHVEKYFYTFKEFLFASSYRLKFAGYRNDSTEKRIDSWIAGGGDIAQMKEWAQAYGNAMQPVIDAFKGQTNIVNAIGRLQQVVIPGMMREDGSFPDWINVRNNTGFLLKSRGDFSGNPEAEYNLLTNDWQNLIADEQDILLSDISTHNRTTNKEISRTGLQDYRKGVIITSTETFNAPFSFKGVGFGETGWIGQEERSRVINASFDAFKDLAAVIGAPDDGMSLGHNLAVQYGNLGHKAKGGAAAYFPAVKTINFTRDNGDGTMAHEWGHALQDLSGDAATIEIEHIIETFFYIYDFEAGERLVDDLLAKDSTFLKRMVSNKKQARIEAVKEEVSNKFTSAVKKETDYYKTARIMDNDYTTCTHEMWARAFESYIYDTLPGGNNYLVNDFVAAGRVGGKSGVGMKLVYPSGIERETFNATIGRFLHGLVWENGEKPDLSYDYIKVKANNEQLLKEKLDELLATVEERYKAIWASEQSADGLYWYQYDETTFGPMMQPDGYEAYDKEVTSEGQNGIGAVGYLTQLHPDVMLDYKLSNITYAGKTPTYIKEGGGFDVSFQEDGAETLDEVSAGDDRGTKEEGNIRSGDRGGGEDGESGTWEAGKQRSTSTGSEGDSLKGIYSTPAGNYIITDKTLNDPKTVTSRFTDNIAAIRMLKKLEEENRLAEGPFISIGTEPPPGGWKPEDKVPGARINMLDEKGVLARYSGWGGMAELFAWSPSPAWEGKAEIVKAELTSEELAEVEASSPSSYYTPVPVGQFMWKLAQRLGFQGGVVLDPATGANGLFLGTMPTDLTQSTTLQAIEMDDISARIASKLYGKATVEHKSFQDAKKPNNRYDLTITNVPFENVAPADTKHNKGGYYLHNYFINKMIDLTAPGALSMVITTSNTMDKAMDHLTEYSGKADLVGAIRLPSGIFSATDVVTDILVFRKKIGGSKFSGIPVDEWTTAGKDSGTGLTINNYFLNHPEMIVGKIERVFGRYGNEALRVIGEGDLLYNLENLASAFPAKIVEREVTRETKSIDDLIPSPETVKEGGLYINDKDEVCLKDDGQEEKLPIGTESEKKKANIARGYVNLRSQVFITLRTQKTETNEDVVKAEQSKLKKYYDAFVENFGPINNPKNYEVYSDDPDYGWVVMLEEYDPDAKKVTKLADIFTKNITGGAHKPERADTDHDALAYSLDEFGYPNLEYMAKLRDSDVATVLSGIHDKVVENPETGFLETMDEYLSGNVKRKLKVAKEMAESNPEYERNVKLLESSLPSDIPSHRITARIGASWIKPEHLTTFVKKKISMNRKLETVFNFNPVSNEWKMTFQNTGWKENKAQLQRDIDEAKRSIEATRTWGTMRRGFFDLIEDALAGKRPVVTSYDPVTKKTYMDVVATKAAEDKLQDIQMEFGQWIFRYSSIRDEAVHRFNEIINTSIPMKADGSHLTFPGKSMLMITQKEADALGVKRNGSVVFYPHQTNAAWKYLKNGNIYLAHEVGAGKTVTMALIAMEAKRLRGKRKVVYVTLNDSTMGQAITEIKALYPMANILPVRVSTNEQRKQRALQKMALNDFDIAIMRQQDLNRIALSPETERVFIEEELQEYREILEEAKNNGARIQERDIQTKIKKLAEKLKAPRVYEEAKNKNLFFDDIGIDLLIVDEAHQYKNVPYATRLTRITGLNPPGSATAKEFFRKTQYLNSSYPKHDSLVLASGTALSNSIAEMYNLQRMLQPQDVKRQGVWSFDRWIANFGDMGSQMEWDGARGVYKNITTNRRIVNAGRMLATAYQNVDSVRAKDTPIKRPDIKGGEPQRVIIKPNQYVEDYKQIILQRCKNLDDDPRNAEYEGVPDNMLRIISNMSKVAIDQRLDSKYANTEMQQDSKIAVASNKIFQRWKEEKEHKGVQLIFADLGTPKRFDNFKYKTDEQLEKMNDEELISYNEELLEHETATEGFNVYDGLKQELIKMGIPRNQIAFIHDADHSNKNKKAENLRSLFKKVNSGDIRILIGSTSKAGTGVNVQGRVSDIHHLDVWWNYSAWEQRNGRGIRAGNFYADLGGTYIWNYVTETTVDATRWDKIFSKGKVLNSVLGGDINIDVIEDISDETMSAKMMAAEASGDPLMATHATLLQDVQTLRFAQAAYLDNVRTAKIELAQIPGRIETAKKNIVDFNKSHDLMEKVTAVRFMGDDRTYIFEKHGKEIIAALEKAIAADPETWTADKKKALLVFGSYTENEVTETIAGKEKKVKKYTFAPLPVKASITGQVADPYGRRILLSGDILSSDRQLATIKVSKNGKAEIDLKANVSRTVTEYISLMNKNGATATELIKELEGKEPKLRSIIEQPWGKLSELEEKSRQLREIETQMAARGQNTGNPETGISIDKYQSIIPVLDDVAAPDGWNKANGVIYAGSRDVEFGISASVELKNFFQNRSKHFNPEDTYYPAEEIAILQGTTPEGAPTKPIAYTYNWIIYNTINGDSLFWVPIADGSFVTVDPIKWTLMERMLGKDNSWYHDMRRNEDYMVHVNSDGQRDAFIKAKREDTAPSGVRELYNNSSRQTAEKTQYARSQTTGPVRAITLDEVKAAFPNQRIERRGDNFTITLKNGVIVRVSTVPVIEENAIALELGYGEGASEETDKVIVGSYQRETGAAQDYGQIRLLKSSNGVYNLSHESIHFLEDFGIISQADTIIIDRKIKRDGKWDAKMSPGENRAYFLADELNAPPPATAAGKVWTKIKDFVDRLRNLFGDRTVGGITREIASGDIFSRESATEAQGPGTFKPDVQFIVEKIINMDTPYKRKEQTEPPPKDAPDSKIKEWVKDETDAILQTAASYLPKNHPSLGFIEKLLKSPEYYDHPVFNRIVRLFTRDRDEIFHEYIHHLLDMDDPNNAANSVNELAQALKFKGLSFWQRMAGESSKDYKDLTRIIDEADTTWVRDQKKPLAKQVQDYENHIRKQGISEEVIAIWKYYRESYDRALGLMTKQMGDMINQIEEEAAFTNGYRIGNQIFKTMPEAVKYAKENKINEESIKKAVPPGDYSEIYNTLKGAIARMETWKGFYAPRQRRGNWVISASRGEGETKEYYREHKYSQYAARKIARRMEREGWTVKGVTEIEKLPEDVYQDVKTASLANTIDHALERMKSGKLGADMQDMSLKFNEEVLHEVADMIRMRGFRSSMIHRKVGGKVVSGYETDPIERHITYSNNVARGLAKAQVARAAYAQLLGTYLNGKRMGGISASKEPRVFTTADDYIKEQFRNLDKTDRIIGWAKSIATLKFLGFNARSLLVNTTAMATTAPAAIHAYAMGGRGSMMKVARYIGVSGKDYAKFMSGNNPNLTPDERNFLDEEHRLGQDAPQYTREALAVVGKVHNMAWNKMMSAAMWGFGVTEQWNRGTTMLAAYRLARKNGLDHSTAAEMAKTTSDKAHGIYGRATLPAVAWGNSPSAKIAQMMYMYTKFSHNYLQMLYEVGIKKGNMKAALYGMISPIILGGLAAVPFKDKTLIPLVKMIAVAAGLMDKDEDLEKSFWKWTRSLFGDTVETAGRYGTLGAIGLDISGSLAIGVGIPKDLSELIGPIGGVIKEVGATATELRAGNVRRAAEHILPSGLANVARAYRESQEGVTSAGRKNRVWDETGRPFMPTTGETVKRAVGFRSARQASLTERLWEGKRQAQNFQGEKGRIYEAYRVYLADPKRNFETFKEIRQEVRDFNRKLKDLHLSREIAPITYQSMRMQAKNMNRATKRERVMLK